LINENAIRFRIDWGLVFCEMSLLPIISWLFFHGKRSWIEIKKAGRILSISLVHLQLILNLMIHKTDSR
jgi:hypothetical protein